MKFKVLESSEIKDRYFYRRQKWDWLTREMIHVFDSNNPRMITMDYWPQKIFLSAEGHQTVSEFVHYIASKYPKSQIPDNLDLALLEEMESLLNEGLIAMSDNPVSLEVEILNPLTKEGIVDMEGGWNGTYTYNIPDEYKDDKMHEVEFTIEINSVTKNKFQGTVQDNLETGGTPGVGQINGNFDEYQVTFEKQMPIYAGLTKERKHFVDKKRKHPVIVYQGEFSRSKEEIYGAWWFKKSILAWKGILPVWHKPNGNFTMKKIKI